MKNMSCYSVNEERLLNLAGLLLSKEYKWYEYRLDCRDTKKDTKIERWMPMPVLECVISETINIYPKEWHINPDNGFAYYEQDKLKNPCTSAMIFFELEFIMFKHLFVPYHQLPHYFGGKILGFEIKPADIGNNIQEFVKNYKSIMN